MIEDERYASAPVRFQNREACIRELDAVFATRTLAEWRVKLASMEGPWGPMQSAEEIHDDPQTIANHYLVEVESPERGRFKLVANPVQFDEQPPELGPAPEHGQHTDEVLAELGHGPDEIARLHAEGVVAGG
jgi:crotonobetainyl-CoA:carnitine CoA-transferase CaiB-like acyl-CoA transferase